MKLKELLNRIDNIAPFSLQENYDNSGLQFGDLNSEIRKILITLEVTGGSVERAIKSDANVILAHHPILFFPIKKIIKQDMPVFFKAVTSGINIIAVHTNFDISENGLNDYVGNLLGIRKERPIQMSNEKIYKLAVYVPADYANKLRDVLFSAGAGKIGNYSDSSFNIFGIGTFKPLEGSKPFVGKEGTHSSTEEVKIETIVPERFVGRAIAAMKRAHPYEEPAYDIYELKIDNINSGIGMIGSLEKTFSLDNFALFVKEKLQANYLRFIGNEHVKIQRVALCTGAGSSLLEYVRNKNVDLFITGDITYHTAVHAKELGVNILDVEHFDSEKFFVDAIYESLLKEKIDSNLLVKYNNENSPYKLIR